MEEAMLTVTEALAEIKTIGKRIAKKREFVVGFLFRQERMKDPLEKEGGSRSAIERERQSIHDLEQRIVDLRRGIATVNATTDITVATRTMSIADWLTWRREVASGERDFVARMISTVQGVRKEAIQKGLQIVTGGDASTLDDVVVNVDEQGLAMEAEQIEEILGTLDGLLSLKNATVTIDV